MPTRKSRRNRRRKARQNQRAAAAQEDSTAPPEVLDVARTMADMAETKGTAPMNTKPSSKKPSPHAIRNQTYTKQLVFMRDLFKGQVNRLNTNIIVTKEKFVATITSTKKQMESYEMLKEVSDMYSSDVVKAAVLDVCKTQNVALKSLTRYNEFRMTLDHHMTFQEFCTQACNGAKRTLEYKAHQFQVYSIIEKLTDFNVNSSRDVYKPLILEAIETMRGAVSNGSDLLCEIMEDKNNCYSCYCYLSWKMKSEGYLLSIAEVIKKDNGTMKVLLMRVMYYLFPIYGKPFVCANLDLDDFPECHKIQHNPVLPYVQPWHLELVQGILGSDVQAHEIFWPYEPNAMKWAIIKTWCENTLTSGTASVPQIDQLLNYHNAGDSTAAGTADDPIVIDMEEDNAAPLRVRFADAGAASSEVVAEEQNIVHAENVHIAVPWVLDPWGSVTEDVAAEEQKEMDTNFELCLSYEAINSIFQATPMDTNVYSEVITRALGLLPRDAPPFNGNADVLLKFACDNSELFRKCVIIRAYDMGVLNAANRHRYDFWFNEILEAPEEDVENVD